MPNCIKCGTENAVGVKYCSSCGAVLPQMAPTGIPSSSSLDVDENTEYLAPTSHYPAEELLNLAWTANDFLEEGAELEPFIEAYEIVRNKFVAYQRDHMATFQDLIADDRARNPDDPYPKQLAYLHNKGVTFANEGMADVDEFLDALDEDQILPDRLKEGVVKLVQANDHFCLSAQLVQARIDAVSKALADAGITQDENGELVVGVPPGGYADDDADAVPAEVGD